MASALGRRSVGLGVTSKHPSEHDKKYSGSQGISEVAFEVSCYFAAYKITLTEIEGNLKIIVR